MLHRHCKTCRNPLHADDTHAVCVSCLGKSHADAALSRAEYLHCECFSLASLRSRIAFFSESDSAPHALTFSSSQETVRKNSGAEDGRRGRAIRPSRAEPHLHSLDAHTRRLGKRLRHSMAVVSGLQGQDACQ